MVRLRSVDPEEPEEIGRGRLRDLFRRDAAQARDLGGDVRHIGRLVALAPERHGREVWRIGLDQQPVERNAPATSLTSCAFLNVTMPESEM